MKETFVTLVDLCTTTQGVQITKFNTSDKPYDNGYRYLYIADFISDKKLSFVDNVYDNKKVTEDDLVMANTGSPGRVFKGKDGILSNNLFKISFDKNVVDRDYLYLILSSDIFQNMLQKQMKGGIQKHLGHVTISRQEIPLPPLEEQKRIAAILDKADALRRKRQQAIDLTDQLLRSVFLDMFGDPVTNPKGWEMVDLESVCRKITDGTHHSPKPQESGVHYVTAKHVKPNRVDFDSKPTYISEKAHKEIYTRCNPELKDVLYIKDGATTGIAAINPFDFEFSMLSSLALIKVDKKQLLPEFLCDWLNFDSVKKRILRNISGAAITRLTIRKIKDIKIELPPIELQEAYCKVRSKVMESKLRFDSSIDDTENLFSSLTQQAFRGELTKQTAAA